MNHEVEFTFLPNFRGDLRRITVIVAKYPFKPSIGEEVEIPIGQKEHPRHRIYGTIKSVIHRPTSCYFSSAGITEVLLDCIVEVNLTDFDIAYEWLLSRKRLEGLKSQWENWDVWTIMPS